MITQKRLKELTYYDEVTGELFWKVDRKGVKKGDKVGYVATGTSGVFYLQGKIEGFSTRVHRLIWLYVYGVLPEKQIDHIDGDGLNNRLENLREVSQVENLKNCSLSKNNVSGITGVCWEKACKSWKVQIGRNSVYTYLGRYKDFFEACCVRKSAENKYGYHENHGRAKGAV